MGDYIEIVPSSLQIGDRVTLNTGLIPKQYLKDKSFLEYPDRVFIVGDIQTDGIDTLVLVAQRQPDGVVQAWIPSIGISSKRRRIALL